MSSEKELEHWSTSYDIFQGTGKESWAANVDSRFSEKMLLLFCLPALICYQNLTISPAAEGRPKLLKELAEI